MGRQTETRRDRLGEKERREERRDRPGKNEKAEGERKRDKREGRSDIRVHEEDEIKRGRGG